MSGEVPDSEWSLGRLVVAGDPMSLRAARVELPEENPDPTVLPTITLLERAVSRGIDPEELPLPPGQLLAGQYLLIRPLGYGGMGKVYLALDTKVDDREVAIKILRPSRRRARRALWSGNGGPWSTSATTTSSASSTTGITPRSATSSCSNTWTG